MIGHIIGLLKMLILLSIAVMAIPVVFIAWSCARSPQPGEAIPDSLAATLHGGTCYEKHDNTCDVAGMGSCSIAKKPCGVQSLKQGWDFPAVGTEKPKAGATAYCCGNGGIGCTDVWDGYESCGSGSQ